MSENLEVSDLELHAFVDGELDAGRRQAVEAAMARDGAMAIRVATYRSDKALLKSLYAPLSQQPLPADWVARARAGAAPPAARHPWRLVGAIAAMFFIVLGGVNFYLGHHVSSRGDVVEAALAARYGAAGAQQDVRVNSLSEARGYDAALAHVVNVNVKVPDLARSGYRVEGLRLYDHAAQILYRDRRGNIFTLYMRPSDGKTRFDQFDRNGMRLCVWQDDRIATVMAGNLSAAMMQRMASITYLGLTT